jgi:hypothetical protein
MTALLTKQSLDLWGCFVYLFDHMRYIRVSKTNVVNVQTGKLMLATSFYGIGCGKTKNV